MKEERKKKGRNRRRIKLASGKMSLMQCILVRHKNLLVIKTKTKFDTALVC